jgi:integrase
MLSSVDMSASNGIAPNSMPGGIVTAKAIRHRYQTGQLKAKDGSWYARFYDEVPDGNGGLRSKEKWKKLGRIEEYPRERDILPVFEGFMQAVNDRLMGTAGPDPSLRVFIEQNYLPSLRLEKKTIRGYRDTWNLHWKSRIQDLTFSQLHPDVAFRILKEIAEQDDISKASLQRVKAFMSGVYTYAREEGHFRGANPLTGLRLQKIKARRPRKMPFNSLAETLAYIKVANGLRAKTAIATAAFAGLTVSELQGLDWKDRYDGQWHVERKVVEGRTGVTKTEARQEGVPIIPYLKRMTDEYWVSLGRPTEGSVFGRWMNNLKRDYITPELKKKGMKWNGWHAFRRGLATNLHEMGVPTKVIQRICRHADEATTKKHYIRATEPGVRQGMRKLEALIEREKREREESISPLSS